MPLVDRLKHEPDRAGKAAQDAVDDRKIRLEAFRTRHLAAAPVKLNGGPFAAKFHRYGFSRPR